MSRAITALCNALPGSGTPAEICYFPEGKQKIYPFSHPEGIWVNLEASQGPAIAANFDNQLKDLLKKNVKPWLDFEHTGRAPSAGRPTGFRYKPGEGLMCSVDWSSSGRRAIRGKDVGYFSPRVDIDENGAPVSLPERGPLGGLVTEPAFRDIPAIAANQAEHPNLNPIMSLQLLAACGLLNANEAALEGAQSLATSRVAALKAAAEKLPTLEASLKKAEENRDGWKKKFEDAETAGKADKEKVAKEKVSAAVAAGKILPKDEVTQKYFVDRIVAGDGIAEKMLETMPKQHAGIDKPLVNGGGDRTVTAGANGEHAFVTEARQLVASKEATTEGEAFTILASRKPELYDAYSKSLTGQA